MLKNHGGHEMEPLKENVISNKDGKCTKNNQKEKRTKILFHSEYDEPGIYEEFRPHTGPGSSYKPWIYGK